MSAFRTMIAAVASMMTLGCVGLATHGRSGITVHDPTYYLFVAGTGDKQVVEMFVGPDFDSTYTVSGEKAFFAKHEFSVKLTDGMLTEAGAKYDTSALLSFFQEAAKTAAGALAGGGARSGVSGFVIDLGLKPGLYKFSRAGRIAPIFVQGDQQP